MEAQASNGHRRLFLFLCRFCRPIMRWLFNYEYEPIPAVDGPVLLLSNHNTDLDVALVSVAAQRHLYFVATENLARMGKLGALAVRLFQPILHFKGMQGAGTVKEILKRIKAGGSVAMFPEGNRSFNGLTCPIPPATGKMAKLSGATLITYRLEGGYFSSPRWGKGLRRGQMRGRLMGIYPPETLKAMSAGEAIAVIERDLKADAYAEQAADPVAFKGRNRALGMESTLFCCPRCMRIGTLSTEGNCLSCACGYRAEYTEYGYLETEDGMKQTITELDAAQHAALDALVEQGGEEPLFSDTVLFRKTDESHNLVSEQQETLTAYRDRFTIGSLDLPFPSLDGVAINQRNLLLLHQVGSELHYECRGTISFNALKYLYTHRAVCKSSTVL